MRKHTLKECKTGKDFVDYARTHGARVKPGHGSHFKVTTGKGMCIVPVHTTELHTGIRAKIIKTMAAILTLLAILFPLLES